MKLAQSQSQSIWNLTILIAAALFAGMPLSVPAQGAQGWKPEQPVVFIVACAPGCGPDATAPMNKYMEEDYAEVGVFLVELEMAKK